MEYQKSRACTLEAGRGISARRVGTSEGVVLRSDYMVAVIEVADSSVEKDRTVKTVVCATARIPVLWIVNFPVRQIEVSHSPVVAEGRYADRGELKSGETDLLRLGKGACIAANVEAILRIKQIAKP